MLIKVTKEHIDKGKRASFHNCPVALAIKDQVNPRSVVVGRTHLIWFDEAGNHKFSIPSEISNKIKAWDYGWQIDPFEFELCEV